MPPRDALTHRALRIVSGHRRGSSRPVVVETENGPFLAKLRGAAQGTGPLVAEIVVAELAEALGLNVPPRAYISLDPGVPSEDPDQELREDLLDASHGLNLGFRFMDGARDIRREEVDDAPEEGGDAAAARLRGLPLEAAEGTPGPLWRDTRLPKRLHERPGQGWPSWKTAVKSAAIPGPPAGATDSFCST